MHLINKGNHILIVHYETLTNNRALKQVLKDVCNFLEFGFDEDRFKCMERHPFENFKRTNSCMKNITSAVKVKAVNFKIHKQKNIFKAKHNVWINSAIDKVNNAARRRGNLSISPDYKNTVVEFNVC